MVAHKKIISTYLILLHELLLNRPCGMSCKETVMDLVVVFLPEFLSEGVFVTDVLLNKRSFCVVGKKGVFGCEVSLISFD